MKRSIYIILLLLFIFPCLTSCKKIITTDKDSADKYIETLYKYQIGQKKNGIMIDLRDIDIYAEGHIKGFISYDYLKDPDGFIPYMEGMYSKDKVVFLLSDESDLILEVSKVLQENGYKKIYIYLDGYDSLISLSSDYFFIETGLDNCGC